MASRKSWQKVADDLYDGRAFKPKPKKRSPKKKKYTTKVLANEAKKLGAILMGGD